MVDPLLAVKSRVAGGTLAEITSVGVVGAAAAVGTRPVCTRHGAQFAVVAIETVRACAGICVFQILLVGRSKTDLESGSDLNSASDLNRLLL